MDKQHESQTTPLASASRLIAPAPAWAALAVALSLASASYAFARPQSGRPNIADEVEKTDKRDAEPAKPAEPAAKSPSTKRPKNGPRPPAPPVEVTFKTDLPETEIFLRRGAQSMQSLGKTDSGGRLVVRLPRGRHDIVASRPGARILRQQIDVKNDSADFAFNITAPAPPEKKAEAADAAPTPEAEPTPSEQAGNGAAGAADEVVRRFLYEKEGGPSDADWQRMQTETRAALEREPDSKQLRAESLLAEGQVAFLRGDHASALISFNKSVIAAPEFAAAHYALGNAYLATNQPAEAFKAYQRAVTLNKDLAVALRGMGDALTKQGKGREAAQYYSRAQSFGQTLPTNTGLVAARDLKKRKRWAEAVRQFEEVARAEPSAEVFVDIGDCYVGLEQPLSASKAYLKATELDPKAAIAHYRYGEVMFKLREYASAMEALERALALDTTGASFNRKQARERANEAAKKLGLRKDN